MTRIVALCALVAGLAVIPGASAMVRACPDFAHNGYRAHGIHEQNIGCESAGGIVRHVIDHGNAGYSEYRCSHVGVTKNVIEWSCSKLVKGVKFGVRFAIQPI